MEVVWVDGQIVRAGGASARISAEWLRPPVIEPIAVVSLTQRRAPVPLVTRRRREPVPYMRMQPLRCVRSGPRHRVPLRAAALGLLFFAGTGWATLHHFRAERPRPFVAVEVQSEPVVLKPILALGVKVSPRVELVLEPTGPTPLRPR